MNWMLTTILISWSLFSTVSCFWKNENKPQKRDCKWLNWRGSVCVKNPLGVPKYVIYQQRDKIVEKNGGAQCSGSVYQTKACPESYYFAEQVLKSVYTISRGGGTGFRTGSSTTQVISNPCSPTVYGADGKIKMMGKCDTVRRKRRNADGLIEFYEEPVEDTVTSARVKRQSPIVSTKHRDVLFLLDESGSIGSGNFKLLKNFVAALTNKLCSAIDVDKQKTRIAAMTFNHKATIHFDFDDSFKKSEIIPKLNNLPFNSGGTCLTKALKSAKDDLFTKTGTGSRLNEPGTERLLILLSDGCANCDTGKLIDMRKQFEAEKISFLAFFIGESDDCVKIMKDLLSGAQCYEAFRFKDWTEFQSMIDYTNTRVCIDGWEMGKSCPT